MAASIDLISGLVLLFFGLSYLINAHYWARAIKSMLRQPGLMFPLVLLLLICGLLIIVGHNIWVADWHVIVTIVGWLTVLKGVIVLMFPQVLSVYVGWSERTLMTTVRLGGIIWASLGGYITYMSLA
jgi:hypothetical protein